MKFVKAFVAVSVLAVGTVNATTLAAYNAPNDPMTQGFSTFSCCGSGSQGAPVGNDLGQAAWSVSGNSISTQYGYSTGAFSANELNAIATSGFTLSLDARVLPGISQPYSSSNPVTLAGADVEFGTKRFDIDLGLDASGNTVVVLSNTEDNNGVNNAARGFGATYILTGNGYHLYQLQYDPASQLATLLVDGTTRLTGYSGSTTFASNRGLSFSAFSGGVGNFSSVELSSVPLPASAWLMFSGLGGLVGFARKRR